MENSEVKDYRLGNVLMDDKGEYAIVEELSYENGVVARCKNNSITTKPVRPFELTFEILEKTEFGKDFKIENENFKATLTYNDIWIFRYVEKNGYGNEDVTIEGYFDFHQFQNLYYSIVEKDFSVNI